MLPQDTVRATCHFPSYRAPVTLRSLPAASSNFAEIPYLALVLLQGSLANMVHPAQQAPAAPPLALHPRRNISSP